MKIEGVTAAWDKPKGKPKAVLVLAHGAGGDLDDALLRGVGSLMAAEGVATLRFNFPYREAGRRSPGSQAQSESCYRAINARAHEEGVAVYCGGKSYGGRIATHIAAQGSEVDGLVLLSYPLHPPGRPDNLRDTHLKDIRAPILIVQGTRDPFATPSLLRRTVGELESATLVEIDGGDHSLRVKGRRPADVVAEVTEAIARFTLKPLGTRRA